MLRKKSRRQEQKAHMQTHSQNCYHLRMNSLLSFLSTKKDEGMKGQVALEAASGQDDLNWDHLSHIQKSKSRTKRKITLSNTYFFQHKTAPLARFCVCMYASYNLKHHNRNYDDKRDSHQILEVHGRQGSRGDSFSIACA